MAAHFTVFLGCQTSSPQMIDIGVQCEILLDEPETTMELYEDEDEDEDEEERENEDMDDDENYVPEDEAEGDITLSGSVGVFCIIQ